MPEASNWFENWTRRILTWMSQREVKTPLAFYFRFLVLLAVVVVAGLYLVPTERRFQLFVIGISAFAGLAILVALLTVFTIKNLVYGEASHRAELRIGMGTEKKQVSAAELAVTEGTEKPKALTNGSVA